MGALEFRLEPNRPTTEQQLLRCLDDMTRWAAQFADDLASPMADDEKARFQYELMRAKRLAEHVKAG